MGESVVEIWMDQDVVICCIGCWGVVFVDVVVGVLGG